MAEADAVDAAEDEQFGAPARGDELAPQFADPRTRGDAVRRALEEIRSQKEAQKVRSDDAAARAEEYLRAVEAGQAPPGRVPAGVDPARLERARLARAEQRAADTTTDRFARSNARRAARTARERLASLPDGTRPDDASPGQAHRVNVTDPHSRVMKTRNGWVQGYNAQLAVSDDHLILAVALTQDPTDPASFGPMMSAAVAAVEQLQSVQPPSGQPAGIGVVLADAGYFSEANLTLAGPDRLIASGTRRDMQRDAKDNRASGPPPPETGPADAMRHRLRTPEAARTYTRRAATVEPVNAHLKDQVGLRRFSRRGLTAAASELNLAAAVVNLLKLHPRTAVAS